METAKLFLFTTDEGVQRGVILQGSVSRAFSELLSGTFMFYGATESYLKLATKLMGEDFKGELVSIDKSYDVEKVNGVWKEISKEVA